MGSRNSSNSVRLVEVALENGANASYLIDYAEEIEEAWLEGVTTVGVTSGASVPEILVRGVLDWLAARGYGAVEEVRSAEESLLFALPPELRRDLKAAAPLGSVTRVRNLDAAPPADEHDHGGERRCRPRGPGPASRAPTRCRGSGPTGWWCCWGR